jgi:hypothetical protein
VVLEKGGSGICVPGATVEIVRGQGLGRRVSQGSCNYWDPDPDAAFTDLNADEELTFRASAPGYAATELTVLPRAETGKAVVFELSRNQ